MLRSSVVLGLAFALAGCGSDDGTKSDNPLTTPPKKRVITADWLNKSLSVLDYDKLIGGATTRDEALITTIDLPEYEPGPLEVVATPDSKRVVVTEGPGFFGGALGAVFGVTNIPNAGTALIVDLETKAVTEVPPPSPSMGLEVTPDGTKAFTADFNGSTVTVIDLASNTVSESIQVGNSPEELSISPDGSVGAVNIDSTGTVRFFDPKNPSTTMSAPVQVGADPGGSCFVPSAHRLVIGQSLPPSGGATTPVPGFSVLDITDPQNATVLENQSLGPGVPYGASCIPGTTRVLVTAGVNAETTTCALYEIDVATNPATRVRTLELPCTKLGFPMSAAIDPDGKFAFTGVMNDNSLMVVDLTTGTSTRIPWLSATGPTDVTLAL